ncbi:SDR family oxidoreductase [Aliiroseovarius subalbicans]|uniref:SDR family NAD(P)-dependent oxidoreductase n=1 Tax=Aliiroseovarius subalbicans TaxID=2925840 RepID=UPI001F55D701|nr:SDR family oxidoreductase [Aliiroseovarius subalbicans]MCI2398135.1 SDR family oxidoreductase [Aliiroseovarius subalbicans]
MAELTGKHALVTGGGTGIGLAIAQALADAGAEVTITGRRIEVLEQVAQDNPRLHPLVMDVTNEASVKAGFETARAANGPITIHVANAGIAEGRTVPKTSLDFWRRTMATNLDGAFLTMRAALEDMEAAGWGRMIAISSIAGVRGLKGGAAYSASKHGLIGLIRAMSEDYMRSHLTFNAICPGYVDTPIVSRNIDIIADKTGASADEALKMMTSQNRHKRLIAPAEIGAAALWLCLPGSDSVNGQTIEISGGQV